MPTNRRDLLKLSPLALAALPHLAAQFPAQHPLLFDIRGFGAQGTGRVLDTPAINAAIAAAAAAGGGTVYIPAGTWLCFSIHLQSNVHLYLEQGATILAADSPQLTQTTGQLGGTYDPAEPSAFDAYTDFGHAHWHNSLLWGENLHDLSITGPGLIHGAGLSRADYTGPEGTNNGKHAASAPGYPVFDARQPGVGNKAIALKNCRNVLFRDFSILKGGHFSFLLTAVDNLTMDNVLMDTDRDGIDVDCCKNVRITGCTVNSPWDDGICPKSSFALGYNRPTENVTISDCTVSGSYAMGSVLDGTFKPLDLKDPRLTPPPPRIGRIKCGTESNGGFKNIAIATCVFDGCMGLALESEDGANLEDIAITNITLRHCVNGPLFFRLGARLRGPAATMQTGSFKRVLVSNIVSSGTLPNLPTIFSGIPGHPLEDIQIDGYYAQPQGGGAVFPDPFNLPENIPKYPDPAMFGPVSPAHGMYIRHVRNLSLSHVEIAPLAADARPAILLEEVNRADLFAVTAPKPSIQLHQVSDLRLHWSRAAADVTLAHAESQLLA